MERILSYESISEMVEGKTFPYGFITSDNEAAFITENEEGYSFGEHYYKVTILQHNEWLRILYYWDDGRIEEMFKKEPTPQ